GSNEKAMETKVQASLWERFTDGLGGIVEGIVSFLGRLFGSSNERIIRQLGYIRRRGNDVHTVITGSLLDQVNSLEPIMLTFSAEALKDLTRQFRACLAGNFEPTRYVKKMTEPASQASAQDVNGEANASDEEESETSESQATEPEFTLELVPPDKGQGYSTE